MESLMLVVRATQLVVLEEMLVLPRYEEEMLLYLRAEHAESREIVTRSDEQVIDLLRALRRRAQLCGAADAVAWGQFVELALTFGLGFDDEPWAAAAFASVGPNGCVRSWDEKLAALVAAAPTSDAAVA